MSFHVILVGSKSLYKFIETENPIEAVRIRDEVLTRGYRAIVADDEMVEIKPIRLAKLIAAMPLEETYISLLQWAAGGKFEGARSPSGLCGVGGTLATLQECEAKASRALACDNLLFTASRDRILPQVLFIVTVLRPRRFNKRDVATDHRKLARP